MAGTTTDAIVIGSGPNGLVAANLLAEAGWEVLVLEAAPVPGGAVRTEELTVPGFRHDVFSAFYPFAVGSPVMRRLHLEDHGLVWCHAPAVLAHPTPEGPTAILSRESAETGSSLDAFAAGDGSRWRELFEPWHRVGDALVDVLMRPFPPVRPAARLLTALGPQSTVELARLAVSSVHRLGEERLRGEGGRLLLAGLALHADLVPDAAASAFYGWLLAGLGESFGFPVPQGGAGSLATAMVRRLERLGGQVRCGTEVSTIVIEHGAAVGVVANERVHRARRAVIADVGAVALYTRLVGLERLPARVARDIVHFEPGAATVKVDWALRSAVPWRDPAVARAGVVHVADSVEDLTTYAADVSNRRLPARPFLLAGQMNVADPTRSPEGTATMWAYTHVPQHLDGDAAHELAPHWDEETRHGFADRIERRIEDFAPGFREDIVARHILAPPDFEQWNANLTGGDTNGGTAQLHQQLIFRPIPGWGRAETPVARLYLGSASAHPGGGVHGAPGSNAARAALVHDRVARARRLIPGRSAR